MSAASSSNGSAQSPWQDRLAVLCQTMTLKPPAYQEYSDRRGGRTAWSCQVIVDGRQFAARNWYDGQFINGAREDAAEVAIIHLEEEQEKQQSSAEQQGSSQGGWNQRT